MFLKTNDIYFGLLVNIMKIFIIKRPVDTHFACRIGE